MIWSTYDVLFHHRKHSEAMDEGREEAAAVAGRTLATGGEDDSSILVGVCGFQRHVKGWQRKVLESWGGRLAGSRALGCTRLRLESRSCSKRFAHFAIGSASAASMFTLHKIGAESWQEHTFPSSRAHGWGFTSRGFRCLLSGSRLQPRV